jgi:hypothetical protein
MYILQRLKGFKRNKKGIMAIEIVIGMFMFLMILSFMTDVALLTWKFNVVAQTNSYLARTVGIQGGLLSSAPYGYPGGDAAYISYSEMKAKIEDNFKKAGIAPSDYSFSLSTTQADYQEPITTRIEVKYKWSLISNFIPGSLTNTVSSTRTVLSEFKYRYDEFKGE